MSARIESEMREYNVYVYRRERNEFVFGRCGFDVFPIESACPLRWRTLIEYSECDEYDCNDCESAQ